MTGESTIDYEGLAQEAMRGVVRKVLTGTAKSGLAGDHHFYISFDTEAPGVSLSKRLKEKYPREMTIVLQHRFWDLVVSEDRFEVKLTFDGIPERLVVPFAAIKVFFDPSVRFGLQFEDLATTAEAGNSSEVAAFEPLPGRAGTTRPTHVRKSSGRARKAQQAAGGDEAVPAASQASSRSAQKPDGDGEKDHTAVGSTRQSSPPRAAGAAPAGEEEPAQEAPAKIGAEIVSLDKFRKK